MGVLKKLSLRHHFCSSRLKLVSVGGRAEDLAERGKSKHETEENRDIKAHRPVASGVDPPLAAQQVGRIIFRPDFAPLGLAVARKRIGMQAGRSAPIFHYEDTRSLFPAMINNIPIMPAPLIKTIVLIAASAAVVL
jgi:hypothetical protein